MQMKIVGLNSDIELLRYIRAQHESRSISDGNPFKGIRVNIGFSTIFNISIGKK